MSRTRGSLQLAATRVGILRLRLKRLNAPAAASFWDDAVQDGGRNKPSVKTPVIRATLSLIGKDETSFGSTARISDGRGLNG
jgi:hypothetical protein